MKNTKQTMSNAQLVQAWKAVETANANVLNTTQSKYESYGTLSVAMAKIHSHYKGTQGIAAFLQIAENKGFKTSTANLYVALGKAIETRGGDVKKLASEYLAAVDADDRKLGANDYKAWLTNKQSKPRTKVEPICTAKPKGDDIEIKSILGEQFERELKVLIARHIEKAKQAQKTSAEKLNNSQKSDAEARAKAAALADMKA